MLAYLVQFGSFVFPPGFAPVSQESPRDLAEQERPRAAGSVTQAARHQSRRLVVEGAAMGFGGGATAIQSAEDLIRGACEGTGIVQPLYFGRSDRYVNAQVTSLSESYKAGGGGSWLGASHQLLISFLASDPYFYAAATTTATGLANTGGTVTPGGNASAFATWTISVTTGATGAIVLINSSTGQIATLGTAATVWANGDVVILTRTSGLYTITKNGAAAPGLLVGLIPTLQVGANIVTLAGAGGMALAALQCVFTARWQS